jgi:uncharacterized protein
VTASAYLWRRLDLDGRNFVRLDDGNGDAVSVQGDEICAEGDERWAARFAITLDARWRHRRTTVEVIDLGGIRRLELVSSDDGKAWTRDGEPDPSLAGCTDVDLAGNPFTNAFVTRRIAPAVGAEIEVRAAYIETPALSVRPVVQRYHRLEEHRWVYSDDEYGRVEFTTDTDGIVVGYENLARRL